MSEDKEFYEACDAVSADAPTMRSEAEVRGELQQTEFHLRNMPSSDHRRLRWEHHRDALKWVLREE